MDMRMDVIEICRRVACMSQEQGRTTRTFLSPPMRDVHSFLGTLMERLGMRVWVDAAGNLRGLHGDPEKPRVLVASHLDTVPNAGAFDGILGVILGLALVEKRPGISVEVIGFSEEEGVRFGIPFIGSRALVGATDWRNPAIEDAIRSFGLNPAELPDAIFSSHAIAYLEFHIEQGPVLESLSLPLAIVETIVGQSRFLLTFKGMANHAGTTPMQLRHDALTAASRWILEVETYALSQPGLVATVGELQVTPNVGNVIPGEVRASLDVRHAEDEIRRQAVDVLLRKAGTAHAQRLDQNAVRMDSGLTDLLAKAVRSSGLPVHRMSSGAGHDAMVVAPHLPSAMLFLRSPGGVSHHPDEAVLPNDVDAAVAVGLSFLSELESRYA